MKDQPHGAHRLDRLRASLERPTQTDESRTSKLLNLEKLRELQQRFRKLRITSTAERRKLISEAFQIACIARVDSTLWAEICRDPLFTGRKQRPQLNRPSDALRVVLRLLRGFDEPGVRSATDFVADWHRALAPLWSAKIPANRGADLIAKHGRQAANKIANVPATENPCVHTEIPRNRGAVIRIPADAGAEKITKLPVGAIIRLKITEKSGKSVTAEPILRLKNPRKLAHRRRPL